MVNAVRMGKQPRLFALYRVHDVSGISGTGLVAWGTEWPSGHVSLEWAGGTPSWNTYQSIADVHRIHGHEGSTVPVYFSDVELSQQPVASNGVTDTRTNKEGR